MAAEDRAPPQHLNFLAAAQEGLTNVVRHAHASRAEISLVPTATGVTLRISDDGSGMNGAAEGAGVRGMRERALLVGGSLRIDSPPSGGVDVLLHVPTPASV